MSLIVFMTITFASEQEKPLISVVFRTLSNMKDREIELLAKKLTTERR